MRNAAVAMAETAQAVGGAVLLSRPWPWGVAVLVGVPALLIVHACLLGVIQALLVAFAYRRRQTARGP